MTRPIVFASDIHLAADRPAIVELFLRFLREVAIDAQSLYLLGDVFEYWVGDDDARVRAYEIMGDRPRAVEIMERRLLAD